MKDTGTYNICAVDIQAGKNIKLDLNGKTISCTNNSQLSAFYVFYNLGTLEVTDSSQDGSGMIHLQQKASLSSSYNYAAVVNNTSTTGSFTLSGGTLKVESDAAASIAGIYIISGTTNQIVGGRIEVIKTGESPNAYGMVINGNTDTDISDGSIEVTNSTSGNATGIKLNDNYWDPAQCPVMSGSANITAKQTGSGEAIGVYGSADITGGTVTAVNGINSANAYTVKGKPKSEVTISGGTLNRNVTAVSTTGSLVITGGKFDEDVDIESYLKGDAKVDVTGQVIIGGFVAEIGNKGYATLQFTVSAANNGKTVKLLKDTNEDVTVSNNKNIILNLGNNTLTNVSGDTITVEIGSTLTIEGSGTVNNKTNGRAAVFNNGTVIINGGT